MTQVQGREGAWARGQRATVRPGALAQAQTLSTFQRG